MPNWQDNIRDRVRRVTRPSIDASTSIEDLRRAWDQQFESFGAGPREIALDVAPLGPIKGEWVKPQRFDPNRIVLYFHGGGYVAGSCESHRPLAARLAEASEACLYSVEYRLAPEFAFPAAVRDGIDAYRHLLKRATPASSIVFAGDGSGGGLAFSVAIAARNAGLQLPAAIVAMSPWADLSLSGMSVLQNAESDSQLSWPMLFLSARHYLKRANASDLYASPVFATFNGMPPVMVHAGSLEILRDDASRLGDRASESGSRVSVEIYDGMQHVFQGNPSVAESRVSLSRLGQFIKARAPQTASAPS